MLRGWQPILTAQSQKRPDREWAGAFRCVRGFGSSGASAVDRAIRLYERERLGLESPREWGVDVWGRVWVALLARTIHEAAAKCTLSGDLSSAAARAPHAGAPIT